jgi:hypothetical protein
MILAHTAEREWEISAAGWVFVVKRIEDVFHNPETRFRVSVYIVIGCVNKSLILIILLCLIYYVKLI